MKYSVKDTPSGTLNYVPNSGEMASRKTIMERAQKLGGPNVEKMALSMWVDESLGEIMRHLKLKKEWDNTFVVLLMDHGMLTKGDVAEGGARIMQAIR